MNNLSKYVFILLSFLIIEKSIAQSFGFGCLGFSGIYGGYTYQDYDADNLNKLLNTPGEDFDFKQARGLKVGANIFRAKFDDYFLSIKGHYQLLNEIQTYSDNVDLDLRLNYWSVGMDLGIPLLSIFDLKIIDGGVTFINAEIKNSLTGTKYKSGDTKLGYYIGSGLILNIVKDILSIEAVVAYHKFIIDKLETDSGELFYNVSEQESLIENGGLTGSVQLNLGISF